MQKVRTILLRTILFVAMLVMPHAYGNESTAITLNLKDAEIEDLVRWAGRITNKTIIIHPNVKGRVTVMAGDPLTLEEAYQVFLSTLQVHGYAVVEAGTMLKVIPAQQAKEHDVPILLGGDDKQERMVVQIVKIKNIPAVEIVNLMKPMVPAYAYLAAYTPTNAILIAADASKIAQIVSIVAQLDKVSSSIDIELINLEFAAAKDVANVVGKLLPERGINKDNGSPTIRIAVDERSNSLLMTGDPVTRRQVIALIQKLDVPMHGDGNTQVLYLQYAKAEDLVPVLEKVSGSVQKGIKDQGLEKTDVSITAHEPLNALVVTAPPSLLNAMKGVIAKLDVRRAQVLVEALIVEVNEDVARDLGIEWQSDLNLAGTGESVFGGFSSFPGNVSPLGIDTENGSAVLGSGLSLGYLRGGQLRAIIQALESEANANILSTPTILALDNEQAKILVGENVPFITGSQKREGDNDPFQTIERHDIGVSLVIKPRINTNNSVTLDIEQKVESISQSTAQTADIITSKREIKTRVLIDNDQVLVLGGLIRDELMETESKVPLLGDIPLLGRAFRSTATSAIKRNLMVFIHPVILRDSRDSYDVTKGRYLSLKEQQKAFGTRVDRFFVPGPTPELEAWRQAPPIYKNGQEPSAENLLKQSNQRQ